MGSEGCLQAMINMKPLDWVRHILLAWPQGSALARFFRVVAVVGWSSNIGDAFADIACHLIKSEATVNACSRREQIWASGLWSTNTHLTNLDCMVNMQFHRVIPPGKIVIISSCTLPLGMVITMVGFFVNQTTAHLIIAYIGCVGPLWDRIVESISEFTIRLVCRRKLVGMCCIDE